MPMGSGDNQVTATPCALCQGTRNMVSTFWDDVKNWAKSPYSDNMNATHWVLFLGFMLCVTYLWTRVIRSILH